MAPDAWQHVGAQALPNVSRHETREPMRAPQSTCPMIALSATTGEPSCLCRRRPRGWNRAGVPWNKSWCRRVDSTPVWR
jgi:hypothetical protein